MKKAFLALCLVLFAGAPLFAAELTIGGMAWYTYWVPPWQEGRASLSRGFSPGPGMIVPFTSRFRVNEFKSDQRYPFLGGPILQLRVHERVSFSVVGLAGRFIFTSKGPSMKSAFAFFDSEYKKSIIKYDADAVINISLLKWLKIFAGCKVQGYHYNESIFYIATSAGEFLSGNSINSGMFYARSRDRFLNVGPGLGLGFTAGLGGDFYLLINLSGLMLFGEENYMIHTRLRGMYIITGSSTLPFLYGKFNVSRFYSLGGNGTISLAYVIPNTKATLSLGFRYQVLKYFHNAGRYEYLDYDGDYDHFMGATVSVTYGFNLGGEEE